MPMIKITYQANLCRKSNRSLHYFNNLIKIYVHINFMGGCTMGAGRKKTTLKMSRKKAQAKLKARIQKRIDAAKK